MTSSIAQTRQQLSAIIEAAQHAPQIITKHNAPVAVLVSAEFFNACAPLQRPAAACFYDRLQVLRTQNVPNDNSGLEASTAAAGTKWQRSNPFADVAKSKA